MRTTRTISVSLPPAQYRKAERIARRENLSMSELVREALRRYAMDASSGSARSGFAVALSAVQKDAASKGTSRLSRREIHAEIAAARKTHREREAAS